MKKIFFGLLTMLSGTVAFAQVNGLYHTALVWPSSPALHKLPSQFADADAVYLLDDRIYELAVENKEPVQYNRIYRLIKVNNDKGIETFNKVYIPYNPNSEVSDIHARVITSTGKVINVSADKIREETVEGRRYKLFAMEGIDKGSEVEYSFTTKRSVSFFGSEIFQGTDIPYLQARLSIISPSHLKYEAKGFNGFTVMRDSLIGEKRVISAYSDNIPGLGEEKYGLRQPNLQRVDYKLSYNLSNNADVELYTWKELSKKVYSNLTTYTEKEKKAINKFINAAKIPDDATEEQTICLLEDHMKKNVVTDNDIKSEDAENIDNIIKTGTTTDFGIAKLFVSMLEAKGINYRIVFPSVRDELPLDEELENWNRIDQTLIYFPSTQKFLQPSGIANRYPFVEPYWAGTRGLFLKGTTIGDVKTATGKFDTIPILPMEMSAHDMEEYVKLNKTGDSLIIKSKQILKGYAALSYRPIWTFLSADKQQEAVKEIINNVAQSDNITDIKAENTALTDAWDNKPLIISSTIHTAELLEKAGDKILFKVGELIGPQEQMYQEKKRQLPAEVAYPHVLHRVLTFDIPADYVIKNPYDLLMDVQYKRDGVVYMGFVSTYKVTGNTLVVDIMETYRDLKYPLSDFDHFEKVINAAADFNKIVLVLEKN